MASRCFKIVAMLVCFIVVVEGLEFAGPGPCTSTVATMPVKLPKTYICKCQCAASLIVTTPAEGCSYQGPYPTILFTSGFQATAVNYKAYAQRLASWGFAVVQYDFDNLSPWIDSLCHSDAAEAGFMLKFLSDLKQAASNPSSPLHGKLDFDNMGAAGHSRGGKIAALHYAGTTPNVRAAYLVDPIDGFALTQGKLGYPSAVMLLRERNKKLGITGAGRIAACNGAPFATGNWTRFWEVSAPGSELQVVMNAGHLQFVQISSQWDGICCTGCSGLVSQQEGIELALTPMVAWFQAELRGGGANPGGAGLVDTQGFKDWACQPEQLKKTQFVVRARSQICEQPAGRRGWLANKSIPLLRIDSKLSFPH